MKLKTCIYPNGMENPVYLLENRNNVIRQSQYVDNLNSVAAFEQRNMIYNTYRVSVGEDEIMNYKKDVEVYHTHKALIEDMRIDKFNNNNDKMELLMIDYSKRYKKMKETYLDKMNNKKHDGKKKDDDIDGKNFSNKNEGKNKDEDIDNKNNK